jgi:hypothetical protein
MSLALSGRLLFLARVGWLAVAVLSIGLFVASVPSHYDWLINFAEPGLNPTTIRANLESVGVSVDFYAVYLISIPAASALIWVAVSVVIFWRRSDDGMALFTSLALLTFAVFFMDAGPSALAEQHPAVWLPVQLLSIFSSVAFALFLYLFPNGRFVPRWTRWILILWVVHEIAYYFFPHSVFNTEKSSPLLDFVIISTFLCVGIGSQVYRYRRVSGPVQRQQTKWVVFGTATSLLGLIGLQLILYSSPTLAQFGSPYSFVLQAGIYCSMLLIPMSIGVAIVHDRLWDIDIVINRTLVYGALTASLVLVYLGGVAATQAIFHTFTGQEEQPQLAIVASTLVIAALFTPLRRRIQSFIDQRFYRRKYDARKTLEVFSAELREETDLEALSEDLLEAVRETMQPTHISLWLRPDHPSNDKYERADIRESGHA